MSRRVDWPGFVNARTLAGIPVTGGVIRSGALFRSERAGLQASTDGTLAALEAAGVRTVIDLRRGTEGDALDVFAALPGRCRIPIVDPMGRDVTLEDASSMSDFYRHILERTAASFVLVLETIADAPSGGVLYHCTAGKDRTGLVTALLLSLLGASDDDIADDYTLTRANLAPYHEAWLETVPDPTERERLRAMDVNARRETMVETLAWLREQGGAAAWLRRQGLRDDVVDRLRERLCTSSRPGPSG